VSYDSDQPSLRPLSKLAIDWAEDCDATIIRHCPVCDSDSIIGHGRNFTQADTLCGQDLHFANLF